MPIRLDQLQNCIEHTTITDIEIKSCKFSHICTSFLINSAIWVVLFPGDAHISRILSPGCGFNAKTHRTEGKFCNNADPEGNIFSSKPGHPETVSVTETATPLKTKFYASPSKKWV